MPYRATILLAGAVMLAGAASRGSTAEQTVQSMRFVASIWAYPLGIDRFAAPPELATAIERIRRLRGPVAKPPTKYWSPVPKRVGG